MQGNNHTHRVRAQGYISGMTEDEYKVEIGLRIAKAREARGMSQKELAKMVGVSSSALGMYEQGRRKPKHVEAFAIANALGEDVAYLMAMREKEEQRMPALLDSRIEKLPEMFREAMRLRIAHYIEMAEKLPVSTYILLSAPTPENYIQWERAIEWHFRKLIDGVDISTETEIAASPAEISNLVNKITSGKFMDASPKDLELALDVYARSSPEGRALILRDINSAADVWHKKRITTGNKPKPS